MEKTVFEEEQARIRKRQNDLKKVEDEIHKLETRDGEIDELLTQEEIFTDVAKLMELNKVFSHGFLIFPSLNDLCCKHQI